MGSTRNTEVEVLDAQKTVF